MPDSLLLLLLLFFFAQSKRQKVIFYFVYAVLVLTLPELECHKVLEIHGSLSAKGHSRHFCFDKD